MNRRIQISQQTETDVRQVSHSLWNYHYGYSRSTESRESGDIGQDYLSFIEGKDCVLFVICDGISMSYFGDFAAKFLGDKLIDWLLTLDSRHLDSLLLQQVLDQYLRDATVEATQKLKDHEIPAHVQGMLREVIAAKKEKGSAAVYGCGRIDLPCSHYPEGRIVLAWQGDIRFRLWTGQTEIKSKLGDCFHTYQQWNSALGPVGGKPNVLCESLRSWGCTGSVLLYSDGLKALDRLALVSVDELPLLLNKESQDESSDDISLFHVNWELQSSVQ